MNLFTNQEQIEGVANIRDHENWGRLDIKHETDVETLTQVAEKSLQLMQKAIHQGISTGWYALSKRH